MITGVKDSCFGSRSSSLVHERKVEQAAAVEMVAYALKQLRQYSLHSGLRRNKTEPNYQGQDCNLNISGSSELKVAGAATTWRHVFSCEGKAVFSSQVSTFDARAGQLKPLAKGLVHETNRTAKEYRRPQDSNLCSRS